MVYVIVWLILSLVTTLYLARLYSLDLGAPKNERIHRPIQVRASASLMVCITVIFLLLSDDLHISTLQIWIERFSTSNSEGFNNTWFLRLIANNFVHANRDHLTDNLLLLAVCGLYENRVGAKRFLEVFAVSCLVSSFSVLLIPSVVASSVGASGGIYGLLAALIIDGKRSQSQERSQIIASWTILICGFLASYYLIEMQGSGNINHMAHLLGAIGGAGYCVATTKAQFLRIIRKS